ncbi:MAG TPA: FAD-dependent oxidoreductase [Anaerolineae bacterium]|nr:FAD-dependent oxidoreductase [Anaerolineae bacterium]HID85054.1 FAD-dependent oxidoreductase [Anaerolineales bacterium]HIQ08133.1 FAD-dependent oxidoreductase [Anaerolineaceae bacterium]
MTETHPEVLIIGGGIIGLATAYALSQEGARVTVVERDDLGAGSSTGNAGWIVPSYSIPLASPHALRNGLRWLLDPRSPFYIRPRPSPALLGWLLRFVWASRSRAMRQGLAVLRDLGFASQRLLETWLEREGIECGYQRRGVLTLHRTPEAHRAADEEAALLREFGIRAEVLTREATLSKAPWVQPSVVGSLYTPDDGHLDPAALLQGLARRLRQQGMAIHTHTPVTGLRVADGRVREVLTPSRRWQPEVVVLATGAWSAALARPLGLGLPLQAARGYSVTMPRPPQVGALPLMLGTSKVAVTPLGDRLRLAGTLELAGVEVRLNPRRVEAILDAVPRYLRLERPQVDVQTAWVGLRPCTPDGLPVIGWAPGVRNLLIATGHCMLGVSLAAITGHLVAQLVTGAPPTLNLHPLRVTRFR